METLQLLANVTESHTAEARQTAAARSRQSCSLGSSDRGCRAPLARSRTTMMMIRMILAVTALAWTARPVTAPESLSSRRTSCAYWSADRRPRKNGAERCSSGQSTAASHPGQGGLHGPARNLLLLLGQTGASGISGQENFRRQTGRAPPSPADPRTGRRLRQCLHPAGGISGRAARSGLHGLCWPLRSAPVGERRRMAGATGTGTVRCTAAACGGPHRPYRPTAPANATGAQPCGLSGALDGRSNAGPFRTAISLHPASAAG